MTTFERIATRRQNYEYRQARAMQALAEALKEQEDADNEYFAAWSRMREESEHKRIHNYAENNGQITFL